MQPRTKIAAPRGGFTLIELLTVIAIIGILAAIIIPTVGKVRATATKATCASNLRQLAHASQTFAADNKGVLPTRELGSSNIWRDWTQPHAYSKPNVELLLPYLAAAAGTSERREVVSLLYCPGPLKNFIGPNTNNTNYSGATAVYITYSYYNLRRINTTVLADYGITNPNDLKKADRIPPRYPLWSCLTFERSGSYIGHSEPNVAGGGFSGQNMARADGSVHWVKGADLIPFIADGATVFYSARP